MLSFFFMFSKELEELRKQGEIIPQLMSECESVSQQLQVQFSNEINFKIVDTFTFFSCSSVLFSVQTSAFEGKRAPVGKTKKMLIARKIHCALPSAGVMKSLRFFAWLFAGVGSPGIVLHQSPADPGLSRIPAALGLWSRTAAVCVERCSKTCG